MRPSAQTNWKNGLQIHKIIGIHVFVSISIQLGRKHSFEDESDTIKERQSIHKKNKDIICKWRYMILIGPELSLLSLSSMRIPNATT